MAAHVVAYKWIFRQKLSVFEVPENVFIGLKLNSYFSPRCYFFLFSAIKASLLRLKANFTIFSSNGFELKLLWDSNGLKLLSYNY